MTIREDASIREANIEDLDVFLSLYVEFYNELRVRQGLRPHKREEYREDVERYLQKDEIFLAESNGNPVGFIRVSEREGCYWIEEIYVKPEYRGKGIAKKLVEKAENYVKERDSYVYIMVLPQDRNAMGFWIHMGYRILNTVELAKKLERRRNKTRPIPLLSYILEMYEWTKEGYTPTEKRFLELVEEFRKRGGKGEELLEIFVKALEEFLQKK